MFLTDVNDNAAIKKFTHEWLIRFAELYPFKLTEDYYAEDPFESKKCPDMRKNPKGSYNPYRTKYAAISPLFTKLIAQRMPYLYYFMYCDGKIKHGKIHEFVRVGKFFEAQEMQLPAHKEVKIFIGDYCYFTDLTPGMITWFNDNHVFFYGELLDIGFYHDNVENVITSDELKYLLKFSRFDKTVTIEASLTEPMAFSEVWPLVAHCKETIGLKIKNLIYDKDFASTIYKHKVFPTKFVRFHVDISGHDDISDQALLEFFDFILSFSVRPECVYLFLKEKPISLGEAIIDKIKTAIPNASDEFLTKPTESFKDIQFDDLMSLVGCLFLQGYVPKKDETK